MERAAPHGHLSLVALMHGRYVFLPLRSSVASSCATAASESAPPTMAEEEDQSNNMEALKRTMQYALIKNCDMNEEMRTDCVDAVISATEK